MIGLAGDVPAARMRQAIAALDVGQAQVGELRAGRSRSGRFAIASSDNSFGSGSSGSRFSFTSTSTSEAGFTAPCSRVSFCFQVRERHAPRRDVERPDRDDDEPHLRAVLDPLRGSPRP